ncbi:MAG: hypothetical protein ACKO6Q_09230 [Bacteroidota bacterium]
MKKILLAVSLTAFSLLSVVAQTNVWLYEGCNYSGIGHTLGVGQYRMFQMKIGNDRLQGMQIPNGMKVTIYEHDNFQGKSNTYFNNQPCLEPAFRGMASSLVIEYTNGQSGSNNSDYVTFFNDCNYRGYSQSFSQGVYSGSQIGQLKFNISSLRIEGNVVVKAYLNNEYNSGLAITLDNSSTCLPSTYNDKIGSFTIEYKNNNNNNNNNNNGGWRPRTYATVYSECQYAGNALRLQPGYYDGSKLGILKFAIQSIELPQNLRIRAYLNTENLSGLSQTISQSTPCLSSQYINRIGALVVEEINNGWGSSGTNGNGGNNGNGGGIYGGQPVYFYTDADYRGQSLSLPPGTYASFSSMGFPDQSLSSIQIPSGYRVVLYDQPNLRGASYTLTSSRMGLNLIDGTTGPYP